MEKKHVPQTLKHIFQHKKDKIMNLKYADRQFPAAPHVSHSLTVKPSLEEDGVAAPASGMSIGAAPVPSLTDPNVGYAFKKLRQSRMKKEAKQTDESMAQFTRALSGRDYSKLPPEKKPKEKSPLADKIKQALKFRSLKLAEGRLKSSLPDEDKGHEDYEATLAHAVKQAKGIAFDKRYAGGNMTGAHNAISKLGKKYGIHGLERHPEVKSALSRSNMEEEVEQIDENALEAPTLMKHRIGVTVSDPNADAVTKRKEKQQKFVIVTHTSNKEGAQRVGEKHFKKKGYRVHDSYHAGIMENVEPVNESSIWNVHHSKNSHIIGTIEKNKDGSYTPYHWDSDHVMASRKTPEEAIKDVHDSHNTFKKAKKYHYPSDLTSHEKDVKKYHEEKPHD